MHTEITPKNVEQNEAKGMNQFDARKQETTRPDKVESLDRLVGNYFKDIKEKSECPDTIPDKPFEASDLKPISPRENKEMRQEFQRTKADLVKAWEQKHNMEWPTYTHDIKDVNGNIIRKAGSRYDCHHVQPLSMGGKNEVSNITPLSADVHYDSQGVHASDSPYSKIESQLKQRA